MTIEQNEHDIIIKMSAPINMRAAQKVIDYFNLVESISKNQGTEEQVLELTRESHKEWLKRNASRFDK